MESTPDSDIHGELADLVADVRALLLSEKGRGVFGLPGSSPEELRAALKGGGEAGAPARRRGREPQAHGLHGSRDRRPGAAGAAGGGRAASPPPERRRRVESAAPPARARKASVPGAGLGGRLEEIGASVAGCERCPLHRSRKEIVFGAGPATADLMVIGEAPGAHEDRRGEPFVGPAGEMLEKMLANVLGLERDRVYLVNIVKCRVKGGRPPSVAEMESCGQFLDQQIEAVNPKLLLLLGEPVAQRFLKSDAPLATLRGEAGEWKGRKVLASHHPAFLLKQVAYKREAFNDLKLARRLYDELGGER